ncbi:lysine-specific histone demethylase 1 homolog 2, partial [Asparagus officinalis]|uniref:lysine-specific histone demethylase 1 homolog 2 n=1 Tax=Asparagus officinalis TaxID=4686 RepID=UPI00098E335A
PPSDKKKRLKTLESLQKETKTEALIALSLGFPIDALLPSESIPDPFTQNDYIVVRNHVLATWRSNVRSFLSKSHLKETIAAEYDPLLSAAYSFLYENGYINFGVSPAIKSQFPESFDKGSVVIVGSGLSGLAAARQLMGFGFKVLILEGRKRPGGRVYTSKMGEKGKFAAVGGSVITGTHANPLGVLARQLGIPLHKIRDKCPLYKASGENVDEKLDAEVDLLFNKLLEQAAKLREVLGNVSEGVSLETAIERIRKLYGVARSEEERELFDWHLANLEYANAGCLSDLSWAHWDQDDPYEMDGDHCFLAGGNWRLINALCEDVPILYGKKVTMIEYGKLGVEVSVEGGQVFHADMVLCTVPLGVLKGGSIKFDPELPSRKVEAIESLGFGLLNKVAMVFPRVFWEEDLDTFGCLNKDRSKRGEFFLFYSYHTVSGGAVLIALVAGEAALTFERMDPVSILHRVLEVLRDIYNPRGIMVPDPIQTVCTKWGSDPLSRGSYSHVRVGSSGKDYDILAENIGGRLFFAGEATTRQYPATMHGAFLSGLREAASILHASRSRANGNNDPKKCLQKNLKQCTDILINLFKEPDVAFRNISFVFNPFKATDPTTMGLLRVTIENSRKDDEFKDRQQPSDPHCQALHLYAILSRQQADQMQLVSDDDSIKLAMLSKKFGIKLMGCDSTCVIGNSLIISISSARRVRNRQYRPMHHKVQLR